MSIQDDYRRMGFTDGEIARVLGNSAQEAMGEAAQAGMQGAYGGQNLINNAAVAEDYNYREAMINAARRQMQQYTPWSQPVSAMEEAAGAAMGQYSNAWLNGLTNVGRGVSDAADRLYNMIPPEILESARIGMKYTPAGALFNGAQTIYDYLYPTNTYTRIDEQQ